MLEINIPSYRDVKIKYLVLDYNGTLAKDGIIKKGLKEKLEKLIDKVEIYVLTADTNGNATENLKDFNVKLHIISKENGTDDKLDFVKELGSRNCIAIGNGRNDALMLKEASIGICILEDEGCSVKAMLNSDILVKNIEDSLDMLINKNRLIATLRG